MDIAGTTKLGPYWYLPAFFSIDSQKTPHISLVRARYGVCFGSSEVDVCSTLNTLRPRQNGRHFPDDMFKWIFFVWILIKISLKFLPEGLTNNITALVQIMAWHRSGNKPLSEPMMVSLPIHICITRPQWVKHYCVVCDIMSQWAMTYPGSTVFCVVPATHLQMGTHRFYPWMLDLWITGVVAVTWQGW